MLVITEQDVRVSHFVHTVHVTCVHVNVCAAVIITVDFLSGRYIKCVTNVASLTLNTNP